MKYNSKRHEKRKYYTVEGVIMHLDKSTSTLIESSKINVI